MAMLIETTDDFIRALRENEEFLAAARREIATQDLIELPAKFAEYTASTNKRLDDIDERIAALVRSSEEANRRMDDIDERIAALVRSSEEANRRMDGIDERIAALVRNSEEANHRMDSMDKRFDSIDAKLDSMSTDIRFIREAHRTEHRDMHRFRGNYAIEAARNSEWDIAELFAEARGARRFRLRTLTHEERDDMFDDNAHAIDLLDTEGNISKSFPSGDIIAEVRQRNSNEPPFYIAVEASYTVEQNDVIRASDNAKILRAATGLDAYAVVAGVRVNPRLDDEFDSRVVSNLNEYMANGDSAVFWFRLQDSSLEPPDPC